MPPPTTTTTPTPTPPLLVLKQHLLCRRLALAPGPRAGRFYTADIRWKVELRHKRPYYPALMVAFLKFIKAERVVLMGPSTLPQLYSLLRRVRLDRLTSQLITRKLVCRNMPLGEHPGTKEHIQLMDDFRVDGLDLFLFWSPSATDI